MKLLFFILLSILLPILTIAQINFQDIIPDKTVNRSSQPDTFKIDLNGDLTYDIGFFDIVTSTSPPPSYKIGVISYSNDISFSMIGGFGKVYNLYDTISNNSTWNSGSISLVQYYISYSGNWANGKDDKFLGVRNIIGSDTLYGYIRLSIPVDLSFITVHDYAFETVANSNIFAGQGINHAVKNISVADIGNEMTGDDLSITLEKAIDESFVSSYRIIVVPSIFANTFNLDSAIIVQPSSYKSIIPGGTDTTFIFGTITRDTKGDFISDLKPYKVFVLSVPDGIFTTSYALSSPSSAIELRSVTQTATNIVVEDIGNNNNSNDINICFSRVSCETCIKNYRLFIVNDSLVDSFSIENAMMVSTTSYYDFNYTQLNPCLNLPSLLYDVQGAPVQNNELYRFFIMTVPDSINTDYPSISLPSNLFMLQSPNIFTTGTTTDCNYTDIIPDTTIGSGYGPSIYYYIDLNHDGINDFYFETFYGGGLGGNYSHLYIVSLNGNQFLTNNSSNLNLPVLYQKELLFNEQNWNSGTGYLSGHFWSISSYYMSYGNWANINDGFIGVRIFKNNDTLYGWINIGVSGTNVITIKSFALNITNNSIEKINQLPVMFSFFPNPVNDYIEIDCEGFDLKKTNCSFYSMNGKLLFVKKIIQNKSKINTKLLTDGTFLIKIDDGKNIITKKLIKKNL
ncbi:MAG: T9SS type A sorting domain-containing protein [Bacteroidia bacterium]|nr:T9SS type A sorting domain-containing protein [Bacteroidia bacterium]